MIMACSLGRTSGLRAPLAALAFFAIAFSQANAQRSEPAQKVLYSVKFLCGPSVEAFQEGLVSGRALTAITMLNPDPKKPVQFTKRVSRALPFQTPGAISAAKSDEIGPMHAIGIECDEIRQMLPSQMTEEFRTGFLSIVADAELVVTAAYSARPGGGEVSTLDVEMIEGRALTLPPDTTKRADLVIKDIDMSSLRVRCPSGQGSCISRVPVTVANIGEADAGAFRLQTRFDPGQSVKVDRDLPGLAAGTSQTIIIVTPPADNCYDPDCTICAEADLLDAVIESNEANNSLCRTRGG